MNKDKNPYPEFLIDEASGIEVPDIRHRIWAEGYEAGKKGRHITKSTIRAQNSTVSQIDGNH